MGSVPEDVALEDEVPELLTVAEAAEIMRCHKNTVYAQARQHFATGGAEGIVATKVGGRVYVLRRALEDRLGIKIPRIPPRNAPKGLDTGNPKPQRSTPASVDNSPPQAASPRSEQPKKAPVGYFEGFVARWRIRR